MRITAIPQLYRNLKRWREILLVLQRYGLADWLSRFQRVPFRDAFKDRGGVSLAKYTREQRVRKALTDLGPTFIKLGQVLAARPDLVGPALARELKSLRSNVPADSFDQVQRMLRSELGDDFGSHFASIQSDPMATASIGQVHRAILNDGRKVVIKVQRADIEKTMLQDLEVLSGLAQLAERVEALRPFGPCDLVRQLSPMIQRELNFERERQSLEHFARMLAAQNDAIVIPLPVNKLCSRRVLVMQEMIGVPLSKLLATEQPTNDTQVPADLPAFTTPLKRRCSESIAGAYLTMLFEEGLFHADPHPGNLILLSDGRLGILDFGMVGRIDEPLRETIEEMLVAIAGGDQNQLTRLIRRVGDAPPTLDESVLAIDVADFVGNYGQQELGQFDLTGALNDLSAILHRHSIKLPNQSALLLKMLISLEGTLRELDTSFDSLDVVYTFMSKTAIRRLSPMRRLKQARRIYLEAENFAQVAPDHVLQLLNQARRGEMKLILQHSKIGPTVNRLVLGLMASAVFLGSSLMLAFDVRPVLFPESELLGFRRISVMGLIGVVGSIIVMLRLILAINRSGHLSRDNED